MKKAMALLCLALFSQTITVQAATITTGVINVLGTDLTFNMLGAGTFESIWDTEGDSTNGLTLGTASSAPYFWNDLAGAIAARDALIAFYGTADTWNGFSDAFLIPTGPGIDSSSIRFAGEVNTAPAGELLASGALTPDNLAHPITSAAAWVTFEPVPAAVPEPSLVAPIALMGFAIPFAYRRRKQRLSGLTAIG